MTITAQKPDIEKVKGNVVSVKCPNCKHKIFMCFYYGNWNESQKRHKYCENCGQALDWSE